MIESLFLLVIWLIVIGAIFYLLTWAIGQIPMPDPMKTVVRVIMVVIVLLICLYLLVGVLPPLRPVTR